MKYLTFSGIVSTLNRDEETTTEIWNKNQKKISELLNKLNDVFKVGPMHNIA
jgi:hypothetical protein